MLLGLTDEMLMNSALVHHEALQAALSKYDQCLAQVIEGGGTAVVTADATAAGLQQRPEESQQLLPQILNPQGSKALTISELCSSRQAGVLIRIPL
jgi:hypothetical protein